MTQRVLVTGGTGLIGRRLVARLEEKGHAVVVTSRDCAGARARLGATVDCAEWDYRSQPFPASALEGVGVVFHLMGENIGGGRWTAAKKKALRGSRIESTDKLVRALPESVTDFLCASAIGIYPGDTDEVFDARSALPSPPEGFMARLCHDWEEAASAAETPGRRRASMRIGLVLAESGLLAPLVPLYRLGLGGPVGSGEQYMPWVHVDDLVEMMLFVMEHREIAGPVDLVGPAPVTLETFSRVLARVLGRPHFMRVPELAVRLALGEASALVLSSYNVRPTRLVEAGYRHRHDDLEAALTDIVREYY
jgi:hypothetical protein